MQRKKIASKKARLQVRQKQQHKAKKHINRSPSGTLSNGYYAHEEFDLITSSPQKMSSVKLNEIDNELLIRALDKLCQKLDNDRLI